MRSELGIGSFPLNRRGCEALPGEFVSQGGCAAPHSDPGLSKNKNNTGLGDNLAADAALVGDLCSQNNIGVFLFV